MSDGMRFQLILATTSWLLVGALILTGEGWILSVQMYLCFVQMSMLILEFGWRSLWPYKRL